MAMTGLLNSHQWYPGKYIEGINLALRELSYRLRVPLGSTTFPKLLPKLSEEFLTQLRTPDSRAFLQPTRIGGTIDGKSLFGGYSSIQVDEVALQVTMPTPGSTAPKELVRYPKNIAIGEIESPGTLLTKYLIETHPKLMKAIGDIWIFDLSPLAAERDVEIIVIPTSKPTSPDQYPEPGVLAIRWTDAKGERQYVEERTLNPEDLAMDVLSSALLPTVTDSDYTELIQSICGATFAETLDNLMLPSRAALSPPLGEYAGHTHHQWFAELNKKLIENGTSLNPYSRTINRYSP